MRYNLYSACNVINHGNFMFVKTPGRLDRYQWRQKIRYAKNYVEGCQKCQKKKDGRKRKLRATTPLDVPTCRWGSIATDFIVKLPTMKRSFDSIATWVDRLSRPVNFVASKGTDTAFYVADYVF